MKSIFFTITFLFVSLFCFGQKLTGYANLASRVDNGGGSYDVTVSGFMGGYRAFPDGNYEATDIQDGMVLWLNCVRFPITDIVSTSPLVLEVFDSVGSGALTGLDLYGYRIAIMEESRVDTFNVGGFTSIADGNAGSQVGISPADGACIQNYYNTELCNAISFVRAEIPTSLSGDVTGGFGSTVVADNSHEHSASTISTDILSSVEGVSNDGSNVDFVNGYGLDISGNDGANTVTFSADTSELSTPYDLSTSSTALLGALADTAADLRVLASTPPTIATNQGQIWYVNPNGVNATAAEGDFFKPALSPFYITGNRAHVGDIINVVKGTYNTGVSPVLGTSNYKNHGLAARDSLIINADRGVVFGGATNYNNGYPIASDVGGTTFASDSARYFTLTGFPSVKLSSNLSGVKIPFGFYNANSNIKIEINRLEHLGGGRNWGLQPACKIVDVKVNEIDISGGVALSINTNVPSRVANIEIGSIISRGASDVNGVVRLQGTETDARINIKIGSIAPITGNQKCLLLVQNSRRSDINITVGTIIQSTSSIVSDFGTVDSFSNITVNIGKYLQTVTRGSTVNSYATGVANSGADMLVGGILSGTVYQVNIDRLNTPNCLSGAYVGGQTYLDSSIYIIKIKKGQFSRSAPFIINDWTIRNNSKLIIDCEDCTATGAQSIFWIFNSTIDATSSIIITGRYKTNNQPIVNAKVAGVRIENAVLISGTAAPVASDTGSTNVQISNVVSNSTAVDTDIIEVGQPIVRNTNYR